MSANVFEVAAATLERMDERSRSHTDQVDQKQEPKMVLTVWHDRTERGEGLPPASIKSAYLLALGTAVTVIQNTVHVQEPGGRPFVIAPILRAEVATSV